MDDLPQNSPAEVVTPVTTDTPAPAVLQRLEDLYGYLPRVTTTPTWTPTKFQNSFALNTSSGVFYYYDFTNSAWRNTASAGVASFNTRTGAITLTNADVLAASDSIQTYTPPSGGTATLNLALGNIHHITMPASGNITIAVSNGTPGQCFIIRILQGAAGSQTVTFFTTINWAGGSTPTLTTTAGKADTLGFEITGSSTYDGFVVGQNI